MGCDIHAYAERNIEGCWEAVAKTNFSIKDEYGDEYPSMPCAYTGRNYALFGLLSDGVRASFSCSILAKGFPEDASPEVATLFEYWGPDAHSESYLTVVELRKKLAELFIYPSEPGIERAQQGLQSLLAGLPQEDPEQTRVVFWFDN